MKIGMKLHVLEVLPIFGGKYFHSYRDHIANVYTEYVILLYLYVYQVCGQLNRHNNLYEVYKIS